MSIKPQINDPEFTSQMAGILQHKGKIKCALYGIGGKHAESIVIMLNTPVLEINNLASLAQFYLTLNLLQQFAANLPSNIRKLHILQIPYTTVTQELFKGAGFHIQHISKLKKMNVWIERGNLNFAHYQNEVVNVEMLDLESYEKTLIDKGFIGDDVVKEKAITPNFGVFVRNLVSGRYMGGVVCETEQNYLYVDMLWLHDTMRGKGLSKPLLHQAELHAKRMHCTEAHLDTGSYQAPWLYESVGYKAYSTVPVGPHKAYFYRKGL